eukprot:Mrub_01874.p1 GENE.Mrub_01874~~Mrub_01874.p1  ORF type:complete len:602 (-),score=33.53 Mrub_01874:130-1740(-)
MDQKDEITTMLAYLVTRWYDWRLTWNPSEWAGIEMFYINAYDLWKPDLIIYNELNPNTRNFTVDDTHNVRVWADRAPMSDKPWEKFNIEWTPTMKLEFFHQYDIYYYPLDIQEISLEIHPWMSIAGYGQISLKMLKEATYASTSQTDLVYSNFVEEEDRYRLIPDSGLSYIYSYMWNEIEFFTLFIKFKIQRQDYKFFSVIYFPLVLLLILSTFNLLFCTKDSRVRNSVMLLVSSTVYYTIFYNIIQHNTKFGAFESMLYLNNVTTFLSNSITMVEYYLESEYDLITELSKEFYDKGRIYNDETVANKYRYNYKKIYQNIRKFDVMFNILVIGLNLTIMGTQFKYVYYKYTYFTVLIAVTLFLIIYVYRNINSLYISFLIYKIQYIHKINTKKIDHDFLQYYANFEFESKENVTNYIFSIYDPYFYNKDKDNLIYSIQSIVSQFAQKDSKIIYREELSQLITSLSCDIKENLDSQNDKYVYFKNQLENKNKMYKKSSTTENIVFKTKSSIKSKENQRNSNMKITTLENENLEYDEI